MVPLVFETLKVQVQACCVHVKSSSTLNPACLSSLAYCKKVCFFTSVGNIIALVWVWCGQLQPSLRLCLCALCALGCKHLFLFKLTKHRRKCSILLRRILCGQLALLPYRMQSAYLAWISALIQPHVACSSSSKICNTCA